jgi:hypothetical protein
MKNDTMCKDKWGAISAEFKKIIKLHVDIGKNEN